MNINKLKQKKKWVAVSFSACLIIMAMGLIPLFTPYTYHLEGGWALYVYETDRPVQLRDLSVGLKIYVDDLNITDDVEFNILVTDFYMHFDTIAYRDDNEIAGDEAYMSRSYGSSRINMSELHRWHFMVLINLEGEVDFDNPENNFWNGTIHLVDHMSRFLWNDYSSYYPYNEVGYKYGVNLSHDGYTMDLRFYWG